MVGAPTSGDGQAEWLFFAPENSEDYHKGGGRDNREPVFLF